MGISPDTVKFSMEGPQNKIRLSHYPAIPLLGIYPETKSAYHGETCMSTFTAMMFITLMLQNQLRCHQ